MDVYGEWQCADTTDNRLAISNAKHISTTFSVMTVNTESHTVWQMCINDTYSCSSCSYLTLVSFSAFNALSLSDNATSRASRKLLCHKTQQAAAVLTANGRTATAA